MNGRNGVCCPSGEQGPHENEDLAIAQSPSELMQQPRLAYSRLAHDVDDAQFLARLIKCALQDIQFTLTPNIEA